MRPDSSQDGPKLSRLVDFTSVAHQGRSGRGAVCEKSRQAAEMAGRRSELAIGKKCKGYALLR
jgi:hypothetical protein